MAVYYYTFRYSLIISFWSCFGGIHLYITQWHLFLGFIFMVDFLTSFGPTITSGLLFPSLEDFVCSLFNANNNRHILKFIQSEFFI